MKIRESRFGPALVVESRPGSGAYVLGFKIDPSSKLHEIAKELSSMFEIHSANPELGVEYTLSDQVAKIVILFVSTYGKSLILFSFSNFVVPKIKKHSYLKLCNCS